MLHLQQGGLEWPGFGSVNNVNDHGFLLYFCSSTSATAISLSDSVPFTRVFYSCCLGVRNRRLENVTRVRASLENSVDSALLGPLPAAVIVGGFSPSFPAVAKHVPRIGVIFDVMSHRKCSRHR